jgi:hypothetical protein
MKKLFILSTLLLMGLTAQSASAQQSNKDLVVRAAKAMETAPGTPETAQLASPALKYLIETDEVSLIVCGGVVSPILEKKNKNGSEMVGAYTIGMGAYKIQNPTSTDEDAAQLAGLELALKVYQSLVTAKPKTKFDPVEQLAAKSASAELATYVRAATCGKK